MSVRSAIPAVEGVQDRQVALILGAMKAIIEKSTGRTPNSPQIKTLGANASIGAIISKVNELINRLQDGVPASSATAAAESQDSGSAKAWCQFDGTATGTNPAAVSYNVQSVTRNGVGDYTLTFSKPFTGNYTLSPASVSTVGGGNPLYQLIAANLSSCRFQVVRRGDGATDDATYVTAVFFGNQ